MAVRMKKIFGKVNKCCSSTQTVIARNVVTLQSPRNDKFLLALAFNLLPILLLVSASVLAETRGISMEPRTAEPDSGLLTGNYRALVIGNNNYQDKEGRWQGLKTAVSGARAVTELLKKRYGFADVTLVENGTRREILFALNELSQKVQDNDSILLYYAGHGYLEEETGRGYWVPVDGSGSDHTTFIRNSTIRDEMSLIASRAKHTLLLADSCFSGSLLRAGVRGAQPETGVERYYQKVSNKKSVQIISAGGVEFVDDDYRDSGHSPFTYFLLSELKSNDQPLITVSELSTNVEKAVANNVDQVPESGVLYGAGDELGEFIFLNLDVHVKGVPKENIKINVNIIEEKESVREETEEPGKLLPAEKPEVLILPAPVF